MDYSLEKNAERRTGEKKSVMQLSGRKGLLLLILLLVLNMLSGCGEKEVSDSYPMSVESEISVQVQQEDDSRNSSEELQQNKYTVEDAALIIPTGCYASQDNGESEYIEVSYIEGDLMYLYMEKDNGFRVASAYALARIEETDNKRYPFMIEAEYLDSWGNHELITLHFDCEKKRISAKTSTIELDMNSEMEAYFAGYYMYSSSEVNITRDEYDDYLDFYPEGVTRPNNNWYDDDNSEWDYDYNAEGNEFEEPKKYWYDLQHSYNEPVTLVSDVFMLEDVYWDENYTYYKISGIQTGISGYIFFEGFYSDDLTSYFAGNLDYSFDKNSFAGYITVHEDYLSAYNALSAANNPDISTSKEISPREDGFLKDYTYYEYFEELGIYVISNVNANHKPFSFVRVNQLYYENGCLHFSCKIKNEDSIKHYIDHCVCFYDKNMKLLESWEGQVWQPESSDKRTDNCIEPGTEGLVDGSSFGSKWDTLNIREFNSEVRYIWIYIRDYYDSTIWDD